MEKNRKEETKAIDRRGFIARTITAGAGLAEWGQAHYLRS
jgi:hypothetical protein